MSKGCSGYYDFRQYADVEWEVDKTISNRLVTSPCVTVVDSYSYTDN